jgi:hypothetical protein
MHITSYTPTVVDLTPRRDRLDAQKRLKAAAAENEVAYAKLSDAAKAAVDDECSRIAKSANEIERLLTRSVAILEARVAAVEDFVDSAGRPFDVMARR